VNRLATLIPVPARAVLSVVAAVGLSLLAAWSAFSEATPRDEAHRTQLASIGQLLVRLHVTRSAHIEPRAAGRAYAP